MVFVFFVQCLLLLWVRDREIERKREREREKKKSKYKSDQRLAGKLVLMTRKLWSSAPESSLSLSLSKVNLSGFYPRLQHDEMLLHDLFAFGFRLAS